MAIGLQILPQTYRFLGNERVWRKTQSNSNFLTNSIYLFDFDPIRLNLKMNLEDHRDDDSSAIVD